MCVCVCAYVYDNFQPNIIITFQLYSVVCGRRYRIGDYTPLISYAQSTKYLEYPWHVGLYEIEENSRTQYLCGGSIIHPKAIITGMYKFNYQIKTNYHWVLFYSIKDQYIFIVTNQFEF